MRGPHHTSEDGWRRLKPAASVSTQLLATAALWTVVGTVLVGLGLHWSLATLTPLTATLLVLGATLVGVGKERWILRPTADRITTRIRTRGDGRCLGGALSWQSWGLVIVMIAGGRLLRAVAPPEVVGPLYVAIGTALALASRHLWLARQRRERPDRV